MKVTIWNEFVHEKTEESVRAIYPDGIHAYLKSILECDDIEVTTATLEMPECGLTQEVVDNTDVMLWWGHMKHTDVPDEIAERVQQAVLKGMGLIVLHSGHHSKIFKKLMGTTCNLKWSGPGVKERVWCVQPGHPIAEGIPEYFELPVEEMYGEFFDIPTPENVVFEGWFESGYVFRSGCTYMRGRGKIFYFQPGHEAFESFKNETVQKIIKNAIKWAAPVNRVNELTCPCVEPLKFE